MDFFTLNGSCGSFFYTHTVHCVYPWGLKTMINWIHSKFAKQIFIFNLNLYFFKFIFSSVIIIIIIPHLLLHPLAHYCHQLFLIRIVWNLQHQMCLALRTCSCAYMCSCVLASREWNKKQDGKIKHCSKAPPMLQNSTFTYFTNCLTEKEIS